METTTSQTNHPDPSINDTHPPTTKATTVESTSPVPPFLVRRSSFEPMRLGLGTLPPPVFSRAPPGQRSVPAIEFLNKDPASGGNTGSSVPSLSTGMAGGVLPSALASGTSTPGAGLGNGSMSAEPWNLWSDSTAPNTATTATGVSMTSPSDTNGTSTGESQANFATAANGAAQASLNASKNAKEDDELASALAAVVVLEKKHDKRSSIASRVSSSSRSNVGGANDEGIVGKTASLAPNSAAVASAVASSWSEDLSANPGAAALQPQSFALDPNASSVGYELGAGKTVNSSLIPRHISFSSMLDLPQPDQYRHTPPDGGVTIVTGLGRKGSLTRHNGGNTQAPLTKPSTTTTSNIFPLQSTTATIDSPPSLALSVPPADAEGSHATPASSYGSTLRRVGSTSPVPPKSSDKHTSGRERRAALGIDEYGIRFRQNTNMSRMITAGSDYSSSPSIAFGTLNDGDTNPNATRGIGGFVNDGYANLGDEQQYSNNGAFGGAFNPRRDSGYGPSMYNSSLSVGLGNFGNGDKRGSRSTSWQGHDQYNSPMGRGMTSYSYSPTLHPSPYVSPFNHTPDGGSSFMTFNSSSSGETTNSDGHSSSLLRYPSLNGVGGIGNGGLDYILGMQPGGSLALNNYGSGLSSGFGGGVPIHHPTSPFMRFPNSLPTLGPGGNGGCGIRNFSMNGDYERPRLFEDKNKPVRSPLLEEFRADKLKRWGVRDMHGHIAEFMCDQVGSRYIQESILEHPTSQDCDLIFEEIHDLVLQLSVDVFANFCVQKLLEKASPEQISVMAENIRGSILRLSLQTYGCRVIQKTLEVVSPDHQVMILRELEGAVQKCVRDQNANHVIQKIITTCPPDLLRFVVDAFIGNVYTFATHPYSCRVLQRILENCPERMTRPILEELKSYALNLMQDQYGNYVIQFCLERGLPHDKSDIICQIYGQVLHFSKHKFASNVIEKCIINANDHELNMIAGEVLAPGLDGNTGIQSMLRHEYANYPLQRLIKHTTGPLHAAIVDQVSMQLAIFRESNPPFNAKHLVAVEKLLADIAPGDFPGLMRRRYEDHYISRR